MRLKLLIVLAICLVAGGAARAQSHQVILTWTASTTTTVTGYNVYRLTGVCPTAPSLSAFTKLNAALITPLTYTDATPVAGGQYCYTVTAVSPTSESGIGSLAQVSIPTVTAAVPVNPPASVGVGSVQ